MATGNGKRSKGKGAGAERVALDPSAKNASGSRTFRLADLFSRWIVLALVFLVAVLLVSPTLFPRRSEFMPIAQEQLIAPVSFSVVDEKARDQAIDAARANAIYFYHHDRAVQDRAIEKANRIFDRAQHIGINLDAVEEAHLNDLLEYARDQIGVILSPRSAEKLLTLPIDHALRGRAREILLHLYEERGIVDNIDRFRTYYNSDRVQISTPVRRRPARQIRTANLLEASQVRDYIEEEYLPLQIHLADLDSEHLALLTDLSAAAAQNPNLFFDPDRTQTTLEDEIAYIEKHPPIRQFQKGTVLAEAGEPIDMMIIERMEQAMAKTVVRQMIAVAFYVLLLFGLVLAYGRQYKQDMKLNTRSVLMVSSPVLLSLLIGRIMLETLRFPEAAGYAFPAALIGILTVILFDAGLAFVLVTCGSLAFTAALGLDFRYALTALVGGYAAVAALTSVKERMDVLKAGLLIGIANSIVLLLVNYIDDPTRFRFDLLPWGFTNGVMCGAITLPILAVYERLFGAVTDIGLLELTGLDKPLLQRLENETPGTYQHSLGVLKLSEAAAKDIGANFLLVRAGAMYHDIGKILKPKYFKENQITVEEKSLHEKISPYMSAMVIKNHVKAGIELARQHNLPEAVIDFIPQHQGTTIIAWPYHDALKRFENSESMDPVREEDFRYPGPKPQTIETAIVMLADAAEATVTSQFTSLNVNEDELRLCVQKTITSKFNDGQFDECNLTLRDLFLIRESFVKTLLGRFHSRIAYPTTPTQPAPGAPLPRR